MTDFKVLHVVRAFHIIMYNTLAGTAKSLDCVDLVFLTKRKQKIHDAIEAGPTSPIYRAAAQ